MTHSDSDEASAALTVIEQQVRVTPLERTAMALDELAVRWPRTRAGERARLWHADLALQRKHYDVAHADYGALLRSADVHTMSLAHRGLANVALDRHTWREALGELDRAEHGCDALMCIELIEKREVAQREQRRDATEAAAWVVLACCIAAYVLRLARARERHVPTATKFLVPTYAVLLTVGCRLDDRPWRAMLIIAVGSVLTTSLAFAAPLPRMAAARGALLASISITTLALIYVACRRAGIVDPLVETFRGGAEAG